VVLQFILLGTFLINHPKGSKISNKILAVFLFANALYIIYVPFFNNFSGFFFEYRLHFFRITEPFRFLFGPLLYFYTVSLTSPDFRFKKKHLWHAFLFVINYLLLLVFFHFKSYEVKVEILNTDHWFAMELLYFNFYLYYTQFVIYLIASLLKLINYQKKIKDYFSSLDKVKLSWLRLIIIVYMVTWGINLLNNFINLKNVSITYYLGMAVFSVIVVFILANLMIFRGLQHPDLFFRSQSNKINDKYKKSPLTPELKTRFINQLLEYLEKEKPYLNFNLTLGELSNQSKIPLNYLSQVINEVLNKNFYTFINEYRIKEAIKKFSDPKYKKRSILDILYEVGFSSKSTFYTFFQKTIGTTPSAYRRRIKSSDSKPIR
jgi:AraC-like DNA-binding protein